MPVDHTLPTSKIAPSRVIIDRVSPDINEGSFPAKRSQGEYMESTIVLLCDGHDILKGDILFRHESESEWRRNPLRFEGNDIWKGRFYTEKTGLYYFTVEAAIDRFASWKDGLIKKIEAGEHNWTDFEAGYQLLFGLNEKLAYDHDKSYIGDKLNYLKQISGPVLDGSMDENITEEIKNVLNDTHMNYLLHWIWDDPSTVRYHRELAVQVDTKLANFSAWYEFFPRSKWRDIAPEGNLRDCAGRLEYIADLGFDIAYFPPIHPIGWTFRKGKNNSLQTKEGDVGCPWAIGNHEGGHKSIDPSLGNFDDFALLINKANSLGIKIALDIAFQCSPDHPYVHEHPEWFKKRADGSIQYAENPPKKYQDIVPFDFECEDWKGLWKELKSVIDFWMEKGVRVFRVDNPHTKTFPFWEWAISEIRQNNHDVIFLAEAFTRPRVMAYLAKIGFNQSYTYFAWRHTKEELVEYMEWLASDDWFDFYRPNFWPNTPDILTESLQKGGRPASMQRVILASMLSSNYGIYGPVFELLETRPLHAGREEYMNSEKYQIREWEIDAPQSIAYLLKKLNTIRHENPALQTNHTLKFHPVENEKLLAFTKQADDGKNLILVIVNLDYHHTQAGVLDLQLEEIGVMPGRPYELDDLLTGEKYVWQNWRQYVRLVPHAIPAHIFRISQKELDQ
jgi:starch synthase (maltosyl-transferring)